MCRSLTKKKIGLIAKAVISINRHRKESHMTIHSLSTEIVSKNLEGLKILHFTVFLKGTVVAITRTSGLPVLCRYITEELHASGIEVRTAKAVIVRAANLMIEERRLIFPEDILAYREQTFVVIRETVPPGMLYEEKTFLTVRRR